MYACTYCIYLYNLFGAFGCLLKPTVSLRARPFTTKVGASAGVWQAGPLRPTPDESPLTGKVAKYGSQHHDVQQVPHAVLSPDGPSGARTRPLRLERGRATRAEEGPLSLLFRGKGRTTFPFCPEGREGPPSMGRTGSLRRNAVAAAFRGFRPQEERRTSPSVEERGPFHVVFPAHSHGTGQPGLQTLSFP